MPKARLTLKRNEGLFCWWTFQRVEKKNHFSPRPHPLSPASQAHINKPRSSKLGDFFFLFKQSKNVKANHLR